MSAVDPKHALKLSAWLAYHEPQLFRRILGTTSRMQRSSLGRLGFFGDDGSIPTVTVVADAPTPVDLSAMTPEPTLTNISFDPGAVSVSTDTSSAIADAIGAPAVDSSIADTTQVSGGFWSSIGAGVSNVAGSVAKVASALVSPQAFQAAGNAAAAYFNSQARTAQTAAQQATVNAQFARVAQGAAPAPITYVRNPTTGALTPVYATNTGNVPVTASLLGSLSRPGGSSLLLIGGSIAAVIVISLLAAR